MGARPLSPNFPVSTDAGWLGEFERGDGANGHAGEVEQSRAVGTVFGKGAEVMGRQYHHGVALEAHPFLVSPDA
jgi:hypothetical protein